MSDEGCQNAVDAMFERLEQCEGDENQLPPVDFDLFLLAALDFEILNGGLHQYYYNSSGKYADETVSLLRGLGLHNAYGFLSEGNKLFGPDGPSKDDQQRCVQLDNLKLDEIDRLEELIVDYDGFDFESLKLGQLIAMHKNK